MVQWLGSPPFRSGESPFVRGPTTRSLGGLTTSPELLTTYKSLDDPPSGWNLHFSFHFPGHCWWNWSLKNSRLQTVQKRNVWAIFLTQQTKITNQLDWSKQKGWFAQTKTTKQVWLGLFLIMISVSFLNLPQHP